MKERFILALCLFFSLSMQAQKTQQSQCPQPIQAARQVKNVSDLNEGDWFKLEYVKFYASPEGRQSLRNADIFEYEVTVSEKTGNDIRFAIRPTRVCFHESVYSEKMNLPQGQQDRVGMLKAYRGFNDPSLVISTATHLTVTVNEDTIAVVALSGINSTGSFNYFDSDYFSDFVLENPYYYGSRDVVTFKLNLKSGLLSDTSYYLVKKDWHYPLVHINEGIMKKDAYLSFVYTFQQKEAKSFFDEIIGNYFTNVNFHAELPWLLEGVLEHDATYRIQVSDASFTLPPNVKLSYYSPIKLTAEDLILEVNYHTYNLQQDDDGFVRFEFFQPHPTMGTMLNTDVAITPGDSICMDIDLNGNVTFSGQGAENCYYWYALNKHRAFFDSSRMDMWDYSSFSVTVPTTSSADLEQQLSTGDSIFQALQKQYASQMSPYWLESSRLSFKYWAAYTILQSHLQYKTSINWEKEPFQSVTPYMDYLFQPKHYSLFMNRYSDYLLQELHQNNLTGAVNYHDNLTSKYYFLKGLFAGYPKYMLLSEILLKLAERTTPSSFQTEYHDFISECKDAGLLQKVACQYNLSLETQSGKNIRDLHLSIENDITLKNKADGYILIVMGYLQGATGYKHAMEDIKDSLNAAGLPTTIEVVQPERYQWITRLDTTGGRAVVHFNQGDDLINDCRILRCEKNSLLLIRNDGTIVTKNIREYWESRLIDNKFQWTFLLEEVISLIKGDMESRQKAGIDYTIVLITVLITIPLSGLFTFFLLRAIRKKEKNKRLITELELKAIRSQMNPHFIFNALSSIQHLINQNKNDEANQYLLNFSNLLRMVLATSEKKLVSLSEETALLTLYLQLEQLRVPFDYRIDIDNTIQPDNEEIPGMLIQPIVENAVKHGVSSIPNGMITVHFRKEEHVLFVEITDNGAGFPLSIQPNGFGLKATEERLRLINEEFKTNMGIRVEPNHPSGTKIVISIPV